MSPEVTFKREVRAARYSLIVPALLRELSAAQLTLIYTQ
jgi:hypothetical protein